MRSLIDVVADIRAAHAADQLIIVTGAGVSAAVGGPAGKPGWWQLVDTGRRAHSLPGLAQEPSMEALLHAAEGLQRKVRGPIGRSHWWDGFFADFHRDRPAPQLVRAIRALDRPIVTLNYDALQQEVARLGVLLPEVVGTLSTADAGNVPRRKFVMHLHGRHELPDRAILGSNSYQRITRALATQTVFRGSLDGKRLLFLGCGPDTSADQNLGPLFAYLEHTSPDQAGRHWLVTYPHELTGCTSRVIEPVVLQDFTHLLSFVLEIRPSRRGRHAPPAPPVSAPTTAWRGPVPVQTGLVGAARRPPIATYAQMCRGLSDAMAPPTWPDDLLVDLLHVPKWFRGFGVDDHLLGELLESPPAGLAAEVARLVRAEVAYDGGQWDAARLLLPASAISGASPAATLAARVWEHLNALLGTGRVTVSPPPDPRITSRVSDARIALHWALHSTHMAWWDPTSAPGMDWPALRADLDPGGDRIGILWTWIGEARDAVCSAAALAPPARTSALRRAALAAAEARWLARRIRHPAAPWVHLIEGDVLSESTTSPQAARHYEFALAAFRQARDNAGIREARASIARLHHRAADTLGANSGGNPHPLFWDEVTSGVFHLTEEDFGIGWLTYGGRGPRDSWRDRTLTELETLLPV